jgi:hypothetical protein
MLSNLPYPLVAHWFSLKHLAKCIAASLAVPPSTLPNRHCRISVAHYAFHYIATRGFLLLSKMSGIATETSKYVSICNHIIHPDLYPDRQLLMILEARPPSRCTMGLASNSSIPAGAKRNVRGTEFFPPWHMYSQRPHANREWLWLGPSRTGCCRTLQRAQVESRCHRR